MPPAEAETTGWGSGATGFEPPVPFECGLPLLDVWEPLGAEPPLPLLLPLLLLLLLPDAPPPWLDELCVEEPVLEDDCFLEFVVACVDEVLAPALGETPPLLVVGETPPLLVVLVLPPLLDVFFACCFACLAGEVVVAAAGLVCAVGVEALVAAAVEDFVVLDLDPPPPQAATPRIRAAEQRAPRTDCATYVLGARRPAQPCK
jgi:hypothetical protein